MMRYIILFVALLAAAAMAQSRIIQHSAKNISIAFELPDVLAYDFTIDDQDYQQLGFPGARFTGIAGAPMMPYIITRVAVPPDAAVSVQYQIADESERAGIDILPTVVVSTVHKNNILPRDESIYKSSAPFPGTIIELGEPYIYRGLRMVDIRIYPLQYHPAEHRVRLIKRLIIRLNLKGGKESFAASRFSDSDTRILNRRIINFEQAKTWAVGAQRSFLKQQINYDFSQGAWYKVPVAEEGLYEISGSFLSEQGVNIGNVNTAMIQMFNHGGNPLSTNVDKPRPADLNEIAIEVLDQNGNGVLDDADAIRFYGRGARGWSYDADSGQWEAYNNPYSVNNYYLLAFNQNVGKRLASGDSENFPNAVPVNRFSDQIRFEEDKYNILESGLLWNWVKFSGLSEQKEVTFQMPQNFDRNTVELQVVLQGGSGSHYWDIRPDYTYTFNLFANAVNVGSNVIFKKSSRKVVSVGTNALEPGTNTLQIQYSGNLAGCEAYFDYLEVRLQRPLIAENNLLKFYYTLTTTPSEFSISGLPGGSNKVWDVSDFANVREILPLQNGSTVRFQDRLASGSMAKKYIVFAPPVFQSIEQIERLENHPNLRDPNRKGKLLVIVPQAFYEATAALETFKETQFPRPIETERIQLNEIFEEFSSAVPDPTAIRDFIQYARENWGGSSPEDYRPEYIFFVGDGSYDYRNIAVGDYENRIPVFEISANNDIDSRTTDNYFTALNNRFDRLDNLDPVLSVGRLPANSIAEVENYIRKLIDYAESYRRTEEGRGWQSILTFVADDQCPVNNCGEWYHTRQTETIVSRVPKKFDLKKIYLADYQAEAGGLGRLKPGATADLLDAINQGTLMINFFGHGDPNTWAHEQVLTKGRDLPFINNGIRLPVWVAATCTWGKFDDPDIPSMAESMIWSESGGIAVIAAVRPVYALQNETFVDKLYTNLFHNGDNNQHSAILGDAMLLSLGGGANDQKYHLFGDPSLRLADPEHGIQISSISNDTLKALSTTTVKAVVIDSQGKSLEAFNGKALIRVYDAVDSLTLPEVNNYVYQGGTIFKGVVTVENGEIEGSFIIPKSIKYKNSRTGRMSIYAWSEDHRDAVGYVDTLLFFGTETQIDDQHGPEIEFAFDDQPNFFDGDYVGQQPTVLIGLHDQSGINLTGEVGHRLELIIDDRIKKDVTAFFVYEENSFQKGELRYTLPALSSGKHQLTISTWDNLNNVAEQQINFTTTAAENLSLEQVVNYPNPFDTDTRFTFQYQSPNGPGEVKVKIYTIAGRLIQEIDDFAQPGFNKIYWDGRDRDGDLVSNGVYLYKIIVKDGQQTVEKIEKLAVSR